MIKLITLEFILGSREAQKALKTQTLGTNSKQAGTGQQLFIFSFSDRRRAKISSKEN
jgi:hypothetical protein